MQVVKAEMVLWTAGFVLLTLVINAPLLPMVLRLTGLNKGTCHACTVHVSGESQQVQSDVRIVHREPIQLHLLPDCWQHALLIFGAACALR